MSAQISEGTGLDPGLPTYYNCRNGTNFSQPGILMFVVWLGLVVPVFNVTGEGISCHMFGM